MKCLRILPEMCARTSCPSGKATRNMVPGKTCVTDPTSSIGSSFGTSRLDQCFFASWHCSAPKSILFGGLSPIRMFVSEFEGRPKKWLDKLHLQSVDSCPRMNKTPLTTILLAVLFISTLLSIGLCYLCTRNAMRLVELQTQVAAAQNRGSFIAALAKDVVEYSSRNPAIDPILEAAGIKPPKSPQAPASKSTGK